MKNQKNLFEEKKPRHFPTTRYQGSKRKLLEPLEDVLSRFSFNTAIDLFSGSGSVSYLLRTMGKKVISNDYLKYNANTATVLLGKYTEYELEYVQGNLKKILTTKPQKEMSAVRDNYKDIFFTEEENKEIDYFCSNLNLENEKLKPVFVYAVGQALLKKRPYNLFHRANLAMRTKDVKRSFGNKKTWDTSIVEHALKAVDELLKLDLNNLPVGKATSNNTSHLSKFTKNADLIYMDPPYIPNKSNAIDYSDFYSFLEGLIDYDLFGSHISGINHKPLLSLDSAWSQPETAIEELRKIVSKWKDSIFVFSYRNDGAISAKQIENVFKEFGRSAKTEVIANYKYALAHSEESSEIVIISPGIHYISREG